MGKKLKALDYPEHDAFLHVLNQLILQMDKPSAEAASLAMGFNRNYLNMILNKKSSPSIGGVYEICHYFHIQPQDLWKSAQPSSLKAKRLLPLLEKMTDEELDALFLLLKSR